jgi:phenylpyruvate tautomerase PptA (4-oxalocrotonate tautomerase family)
MPLVRISLLKTWENNQIKLISDKIHEALVEAFKIPENDYNHQINQYEKSSLVFSQNNTDKYILIEMTIFAGRSKQAKKELYQKIVSKLHELGIPISDITIVLNEPPLENWGLSGKSGEETNFEFKINV